MAGAILADRGTCTVPVEAGQPCGRAGRLFPRGYRCDFHRPGTQLRPDPTRNVNALQQRGHVAALQREAVAAMRYYVDPAVLREALEAAIRQAELAKV